jgi:hypothetical protein
MLFVFLGIGSANAMVTEFQLKLLIGWTIVDSKTIVGHVTKNGKKSDSFDGCDYGTVIVFDDDKVVTCNSYGYQYAYRPTAIIFGKSIQVSGKNHVLLKMMVNGQIYDVQ